MKFWGGLKKVFSVGKALLPVASIVFPQVGIASGIIQRAIVLSEQKFTQPGTGPDKLRWAMEIVSALSPEVIDAYEKAAGREIVNEEAFAKAMEHLISAQVQLENAFGGTPK